MKSWSFRDLRLITGLSHLSEIEMLSIENDDLVLFYLDKLGMDTDYAVQYLPSKHRCLQNKVAVGFRAVGDMKWDRKTTDSYLYTAYERASVHAHQDRSLSQEMVGLMTNTVDYSLFSDSEGQTDKPDGEFLGSLTEPDAELVLREIKVLEELRDFIRGPMYNDAMTPKSREEYQEYLKSVIKEENV